MSDQESDINNSSSEDSALSKTEMNFSYKNVWEHFLCICKYWKSIFGISFFVFGIIWTFVEASNFFLELNVKGWKFYIPVILFSLLVGFLRPIFLYLNACPEGLENESKIVKKIAQIQRPLWEFHLARQLLHEKLFELDEEQTQLLKGRVFVEVEKRLSLQEYPDWAQNRLESLSRMANVAQSLLITDFPIALKSDRNNAADPTNILSIVDKIRKFYAQTVAFERKNQAILPPEAFQDLHALQQCWTKPIQNGIHQLFDFLDKITSLDPRSDHHVSFTIEFDRPPNIDEYCQELNRLKAKIPEIILNDLFFKFV